ncbi:MAG: pyridine nucleotide-disulfide oxidoreductase [Verrucomicrobia bacterium]|nr:pyridine nucleotide-disulfide oxidoreductase [Verrucomicrobiota bacterium]
MDRSKQFKWAVVGAGPAGIAALGKLLDAGEDPNGIVWIDPDFCVGDLGKKWSSVPSNTTVELFLRFIHNCDAFEFDNHKKRFTLEDLNPKETCSLEHIVAPLQWITDRLKGKVAASQSTAMALNLDKGFWEIKTDQSSLFARNAILAIGSEPKMLNHSGIQTITLETALNPEALKQSIAPQDCIAVFGSSHSAMLVLANLMNIKVRKVINFYRSPHQYAVYLKDWILFDDTGLKGFTAAWAKQNIDHTLPKNMSRMLITEHTFSESLAECNKAVYATGFQRRALPVLEQFEGLKYDDRTGIIAPGLFGLGIAFPQAQFDPLGHLHHRVGLWKFMDYLNQILPIWLQYANS